MLQHLVEERPSMAQPACERVVCVPKVTAQPGVWLAHHTGAAERGTGMVKTYHFTPVLHPRPREGSVDYEVRCAECKELIRWTVTNAADAKWARGKWRLVVLAALGVFAVSILGLTLNSPFGVLGGAGVLVSVVVAAISLVVIGVQDGVDIAEERNRHDSPHSLRRAPRHLRPR
jgi:hypothetical protein